MIIGPGNILGHFVEMGTLASASYRGPLEAYGYR